MPCATALFALGKPAKLPYRAPPYMRVMPAQARINPERSGPGSGYARATQQSLNQIKG